jgi:hypothetical protein
VVVFREYPPEFLYTGSVGRASQILPIRRASYHAFKAYPVFNHYLVCRDDLGLFTSQFQSLFF